MSIVSEITRINNNIANSYTAVSNKGGTLPATQNSSNLATAINSISGGGSTELKGLIERSLTSITIPSGVTNIGMYAFYQCTNLTGITIPSTVTSIENYAFYKCSSLTNITIPSSVTSIGSNAFYDCSNLTNITIPSSVTSIGSNAFYDCINLEEVVLPNTISSLTMAMFRGCRKLVSINIPTSCNVIPQNFLYQCTSLTKITIPNNIITIGTSSFYGCTGMREYDFTSLDHIPALSNKNAFTNINASCKIVVPDSLYNSWISASNWSNYASNIIKESDYNVS